MRSLRIFPLLLLALVPALCSADVTYSVSVDTNFPDITGNSGYIDLQFNPSTLATQLANAFVSGFSTDGTLMPFDMFSGPVGDVSGMLPGTLTFDNGQTDNEYTQPITFGTYIQFDLTLSGDALHNPNGDGGGSFYLDFFDSSGNMLLADNSEALEIDINPDASLSVTTFPLAENGENPVVSISAVPEPSTLLLLAGAAGSGLCCLSACSLLRALSR